MKAWMGRTRHRGQAMVEYVIASAALSFLLFFLVWPGSGVAPVWYFLDRLKVALLKFAYSMSTAF